MKELTALIIMDGYGLSNIEKGNAVGVHCSPYINYLMENYPTTTLQASGLAVGLPEGQMGNSEVGHLNIGAGRVVYQELTRISKSIVDGDFFSNTAFVTACQQAKRNGKLHLMGLVSDGGVHSHITHIEALIKLAKEQGLDDVYLHCYMDGRDVSPTSGAGFVERISNTMSSLEFGKIASIGGRYYGMDRDNRWDRVEKAYDMLTLGIGNTTTDAVQYLKQCYQEGTTDEFILPTAVVDEQGKPIATIDNGDAVIFFNFRPDRAREMTRALTQKNFEGFDLKGKARKLSYYVCMTQYDEKFEDIDIAFRPQTLTNTLGEYLAKCNRTQLRIAETEKYAHVTFFFNGGVEKANDNETRILINSPSVATYDMQPEMSAPEVTAKAKAEIVKGKYDVMILNFANCDMVGHTGNFDATVKAVATVDECVRQVVECIVTNGGRAFVTADHGNAEKLIAEDGSPFTAHTTNLVPLILVDAKLQGKVKLNNGALCDIAPTMLATMGMEIPFEMTGKSLLERK